jgi:hypothetical protein
MAAVPVVLAERIVHLVSQVSKMPRAVRKGPAPLCLPQPHGVIRAAALAHISEWVDVQAIILSIVATAALVLVILLVALLPRT